MKPFCRPGSPPPGRKQARPSTPAETNGGKAPVGSPDLASCRGQRAAPFSAAAPITSVTGATAARPDQVKPTFRTKCPSLRLSTPPPAQCTMNASKMMARIATTIQKKNTTMPGMAYPATVLVLATAASYPSPPELFGGCLQIGTRRHARRRSNSACARRRLELGNCLGRAEPGTNLDLHHGHDHGGGGADHGPAGALAPLPGLSRAGAPPP